MKNSAQRGMAESKGTLEDSAREAAKVFGARASFGNRKSTPDFAHAARMHRLIDSLNIGGATGERQKSDAWPTE
jgi:hypothetical protein